MDQLIVLHEIYDSFSKGLERIKSIDPAAIEGGCSKDVGRLLEAAKIGIIDQDICSSLLDCFDDIYEMKRLGDICRKAGHYIIAAKSYDKALQANKDQSIRPVLLNNLGQVYVRLGDLGRANVYYKKAFDCFESLGDSSGMAHVLGNIAGACRKGKEWDKAIDGCYRSLKIFEGLGDDLGAAQATGSLGRIYADMGEQELATRYFEKSLHDFRKLGDNRSIAWILDHLGQISADAKNWEDALKYYNKSIMTYEELGQSQSMGTTMSNLGRVLLEKGDASAAVDQIEKALKVLKRDMQPAYQNAIGCMAASYAALATANMQSAASFHSEGFDKNSEDRLNQASQQYARSSDRYLELSSTKGFDLAELKVAASITRSLSYLAKLKAGASEGEAATLAERAASALDIAVINSEGSAKYNIEAFQRVLIGIQETLSLGITGDEPWKLTKSIASSIEHLSSGACDQNDTGISLCEVLKGLSGAIEAERQRADPSEQLRSAASSLERAKAAFLSSGTIQGERKAIEADRAAKLANDLIDIGSKGSTVSSYNLISDLLNYRAYRDILMIVGQILVDDAVSGINKIDRIYVWDESLKLIERCLDKEQVAAELNEDDSIMSACGEPISWAIPDAADWDDAGSGDGIKIIVDHIDHDNSARSLSSEGSLESADTNFARSLSHDGMLPGWDNKNRESEITGSIVSNNDAKIGDEVTDNSGKAGNNADAMWRFAKIPGLECIFSETNAIRLIKSMAVVVMVLGTVDAILYLI